MKLYSYILLILFIILPNSELYPQSREQAKLELLHEKLKTAARDTNKVILLQSISYQYNTINPSEGIKYGQMALQLAKELRWEKGIAKSHNSIGGNQYALGSFNKSLESFKSAMSINKKLDNKRGLADNYANIGNIYYNLSDFTKALSYYQKALNLDNKLLDKEGIAANYASIGNIYSELSDYDIALDYYNKSLAIQKKINNRRGIATVLGNIGIAYYDLQEYDKALDYFEKALEIWQLFGNSFGISTNLGNIANTYNNLLDYSQALEYYKQALEINQELGNKFGLAGIMGSMGVLYFNLSQDSILKKISLLDENISTNKSENLSKSIEYSEEAIRIAEEIGAQDMLKEWYAVLDKAYEAKGDYKKAYRYQVKWTTLRDSIFSVEKTKEIAKLEATKQNEIKEKELRLKDLQIVQKDNERIALFGGLGIVVFVVVIIFVQRRKSEKLLLNILPAKIAKRLKRNEKIADRFDEVSIIFIDIVGYTDYTTTMKPEKVVSSLNDIFTKIDVLVKRHGLEKIKTIGDSYMAVAGLPEPQYHHILATARFALDTKKLLKEYITTDGKPLEFRIGIDTGSVVAGVIGESKFSYDLWGDSVNTASRMESTGVANQIHITENFAYRLRNYLDIRCTLRGEIEIKGKGTVKTYIMDENVN